MAIKTWKTQAPCTGMDMFPDGPMNNDIRTMCDDCPVKAACLLEGLQEHEFGVWGGTSGNERKRLRKRELGLRVARTPEGFQAVLRYRPDANTAVDLATGISDTPGGARKAVGPLMREALQMHDWAPLIARLAPAAEEAAA